jgi:hypothetical protein
MEEERKEEFAHNIQFNINSFSHYDTIIYQQLYKSQLYNKHS